MYKLNVYAYKVNELDVLHKFKVNEVSEVPKHLASVIRQGYRIRMYYFDGVLIDFNQVMRRANKTTPSMACIKTVQVHKPVHTWHKDGIKRFWDHVSIIDELRGYCNLNW